MKKYFFFWFAIVAICVTLFSACKKEPVDYRDKWIGSYSFQIEYTYPTFIPHPEIPDHILIVYIDTTYTYSGSVKKSAQHHNKIIVDWGTDTIKWNGVDMTFFDQKNEITIDENGVLTYPEYGGTENNMFYPPADIKGHTIRFTITRGGLGAYGSWHVNGVKNKIR